MTINSNQKMYENKIKSYIKDNNIECQHLTFDTSCHSVEEAANSAKADINLFIKNICMITKNNEILIAIVRGADRASTKQVAKVLNIDRPRTCTPEEILDYTGYPCGGTPSFGFDAQFLIDEKVMELPITYTGGGTQQSLIKITPQFILKANKGQVLKIRK